MKKHTISVIIPVYNAESYLDGCIKSFINQTFTDFELILVNDGSSDRSSEICSRAAADDGRIVLIDKKNGGVSSARNAGLDAASGDWIVFADSDDFAQPDCLRVLLEAAINSKADFAVGGVRRVTGNIPSSCPICPRGDRFSPKRLSTESICGSTNSSLTPKTPCS